MRYLIIFSFFFLAGCGPSLKTKIIEDKNNIIADKLSDKYKTEIFESNDEIIRIHTQQKIRLFEDIPKNFIETAKNHCDLFKKNTYYFYTLYKKYEKININFFDENLNNDSYEFYCAKNLKEAQKLLYKYHFSYKPQNPFKTYELTDNRNGSLESRLGENFKSFDQFSFNINVKNKDRFKFEEHKSKSFALEQRNKEIAKKIELKKAIEQKKIAREELYGSICSGSFLNEAFTKGTQEYEDCLFQKEKEAIAKQKALEKKLASMSQMERIEYQCINLFKFNKNSSKFKDCKLKVYVAESEAEKIKLQKEIVLAKLEATKARKELEKKQELEKQAIALANQEQQNASNLGSFLDLITLGIQIYTLTSPSPSAPAAAPVKLPSQCFTSGMFKYCS